MNRKQKFVALAITGVMMLCMAGCEKKDPSAANEELLKKVREETQQNINKKNEQKESESSSTQNSSTQKPTQTAKPSTNQSTSQSSGTKLPLDTTKNYTGLELDRHSGITNTSTAQRVKNNKANMVSRMTGTEPQLKVAVEAFEKFQKNNEKFVAYKVIEYTELSSKELNTLNNSRQKLGKAAASEFYRITMDIFQYQESSYGSPYENTEDSPYYFTVTIINVNGKYEVNAYASSLY